VCGDFPPQLPVLLFPYSSSVGMCPAGFLAEVFGRIAANYCGREDELVLHALGILGDIDHSGTISAALVTRLYDDDRFDRFRRYTARRRAVRRAVRGDPRRLGRLRAVRIGPYRA
jgi:hypothetical protein